MWSEQIKTETISDSLFSLLPAETLDLNVLRQFEELGTDESQDLLIELIDLYLNDAQERFYLMHSALAGQDYALLRRHAHSLRGSSGTLGVMQLARVCGAIEHLPLSQLVLEAGQLLDSLAEEFSKVRPVLLAEQRRLTK